MNSITKNVFLQKNFINYLLCKRFAGHSKWANIRHTKMEKDNEKSAAIQNIIRKMRLAVADGKSVKPDENIRLARVIEEAKSKSLPLTTIKNYLEKMQSAKIRNKSAIFETRGPSGSVVLIQLLSDNVIHSRNILNSHLKKLKFTSAEASQTTFEEKGVILTEIDNHDLDKVMEDAIEIGAEEVEKYKENDKEFYQFTCGASALYKLRGKLEELNYKIIQAEIDYIPRILVTLTDEEMEQVSKLVEKLKSLEEVVNIYTNIS